MKLKTLFFVVAALATTSAHAASLRCTVASASSASSEPSTVSSEVQPDSVVATLADGRPVGVTIDVENQNRVVIYTVSAKEDGAVSLVASYGDASSATMFFQDQAADGSYELKAVTCVAIE